MDYNCNAYMFFVLDLLLVELSLQSSILESIEKFFHILYKLRVIQYKTILNKFLAFIFYNNMLCGAYNKMKYWQLT